jgi:VanZ family protein
MAIIFIQSSFPSVELPKVELIGFDKILHFGVYGLLVILCYISLTHQSKLALFSKSPYLWAVIITSIYGLTDEIHQYFVPNRSCEFQDWIADFIGALIGILLIKMVFKKYVKMLVKE